MEGETYSHWQRARRGEQVRIRVAEVVNACARLVDRDPINQISLASIAREAGWTRSNMYRYFRTPEDVMLEILNEEVAVWQLDVRRVFGKGTGSSAAFIRGWGQLYEGRERMIKLMQMTSLLKEGGSPTEFDGFMLSLTNRLNELSPILGDTEVFSNAPSATEFLWLQYALVRGGVLSAGDSKDSFVYQKALQALIEGLRGSQ